MIDTGRFGFAAALTLALALLPHCFDVKSKVGGEPELANGALTDVVDVGPAALEFGAVSCGSIAPASVVTIANSKSVPITWNATFAKGSASPYRIKSATGHLLAGASADIAITAQPVPARPDMAPDAYDDTLTIVTDVSGDAPHTIALHQKPSGALLSFSMAAIAFGARGIFEPTPPMTFAVKNDGASQAAVKLASSSASYVLSPDTFTVPANGSQNVTVTYTPSDVGDQPATISLATTDTACAALPQLTLTGRGQLVASKVAVGQAHTCAIVQGGRVACWGQNGSGQLGIGTQTPAEITPRLVRDLTGAVDIGAGKRHTCAVTATSHAYCWGHGGDGEIGNGVLADVTVPTEVITIAHPSTLAVGQHSACAGERGGAVYCWGAGLADGSLSGTRPKSATPKVVDGVTGADALVMGHRHACARVGGSLTCWGKNNYGALGNNATQDSATPVPVTNLTAVTSFSAGYWHSCAVAMGNVSCWGWNNDGTLGTGDTNNATVPTAVQGLSSATEVAGGYAQTCAVSNGQVFCWGQTSFFFASPWPPHTNLTMTPERVGSLATATGVAVGRYHACAVSTDGSVSCWGRNDHGQLGNGLATDSGPPVPAAFTGH